MDRYDEIMERMKRIGCTTEEQVILQLDRELERSRDRIKQEMEYSARLIVPVKESETTSILITSQRKIRDIEVYFQED